MADFYIHCVCVCVCVCVCIYIYIYIYISFLAFNWGRNPYLGCDAFLGVTVNLELCMTI